MKQADAMGERRAPGKRVAWAAVAAAAILVGGVPVQWFASIADETADRIKLVSSAWSNVGTPALNVVTRLRRSDGRRVDPRGAVRTQKPPAQMKQSIHPDLVNRGSLITAEIGFADPPREPVVLECYALQNRACRGLQLLASWERKLFHRTPKWLPPPALVRLPDITVAGPAIVSTSE